MAQFRKAIEINPTMSKLTTIWGPPWSGRKLDEGIVQLREVLEVSPDYAEARNNLGDALLRKGTLDEAIAQFRKVLEVNPESAGVHFNLGRALARKGRLDEAIEHFEKAAGADPDLPRPNMSWVTASTCGGNPGGACPLAQRSPVGAG